MNITYEELIQKLARVCVEKTYKHTHLIGLSNSSKYDELLYDNTQLLGSVIFSLFPDKYDEAEFAREVRKVELNGVLVQISRASMNEAPSGILSDPARPKNNAKLINKNENLVHHLTN